MAKLTRRAFISTAGAVTGAAAITMAAPGMAAAAGLDPETGAPLPAEPFVAYVKDPSSGTVSVMVGQREVAIKDRALVRRIVNAAR